MVKRVYDANDDLTVGILICGTVMDVSARRLLDPAVNDPETIGLRRVTKNIGMMPEDYLILDLDGITVAARHDYGGEDLKYYFTFLRGYDKEGNPIVEPTLEDIADPADQELNYKLRWEMCNNTSSLTVNYYGLQMGVESLLVVMPGEFVSSFFDNNEMRRLAIEQGVFRPFPLDN